MFYDRKIIWINNKDSKRKYHIGIDVKVADPVGFIKLVKWSDSTAGLITIPVNVNDRLICEL